MDRSTDVQLSQVPAAEADVVEDAGAATVMTKWSTQARIPDAKTTKGPALAVLGRNLFAAWRGEDEDDQQLWYAFFDGNTWSTQRSPKNARSAAGPALCAWRDELVLAWRGKDNDEKIYLSYYNGERWTDNKHLPEIAGKTPKTSRSPALTVMSLGGKDVLVVACERGGAAELYVFDGTKWARHSQQTVKLSEPPDIAGLGDRCYLACVDTGDELHAYRYPDPSYAAKIGGRTNRTPGIASLAGTMHAVWSDPKRHNALYHSSYVPGGAGWAQPRPIAGMGSTQSPALAPFKGELVMAWQGLDREIYYARYGNSEAPYENLEVRGFVDAFDRLPRQGRKLSRYDFEWDNSLFDVVPHVQGMGIYNDYYIFSHSQEVSKGPGYLIVGNARAGGKCKTYKVTTPPEDDYHHPGGMQVVGNTMVLGIGFSDDSKEGIGSWLYFYDLSTITDSTGPTLLRSASIRHETRDAAAVAMTRTRGRYVLATYGNEPGGKTFIYQSNQAVLGDPDLRFGEALCSFRPKIDGKTRGYDNLALVTDAGQQQVYLVGFRGDEGSLKTKVDDYADLFKVSLDGAEPKHLKTVHFKTTAWKDLPAWLSSTGAHFRYGVSLIAVERAKVVITCTNRNVDLTAQGAQMNYFEKE